MSYSFEYITCKKCGLHLDCKISEWELHLNNPFVCHCYDKLDLENPNTIILTSTNIKTHMAGEGPRTGIDSEPTWSFVMP